VGVVVTAVEVSEDCCVVVGAVVGAGVEVVAGAEVVWVGDSSGGVYPLRAT
jgi:hypothetical protein